MGSPVFVASSVYGAELVEKHGQAYFAAMAARSGASGFEIRRELFPSGEIPYEELHAVIQENNLQSAYSVPVELWANDGKLNRHELLLALQEGLRLGVSYVKTTLGNYQTEHSDLHDLRSCMEEAGCLTHPIHLTVENDQSNHGGSAIILRQFFDDCAANNIPIRMTFDVGNWCWTDENIMKSAEMLADYVVYVHFKWAEVRIDRKVAVPMPEDKGAMWREVLSYFPNNLPRVIEFPIVADDLEQATKHYVHLLSHA